MTSSRSPALALLLALAARSLAAQSPVENLRAANPAWLTAWTPLAPLADLTRALPAAPQLPGLLVAPAPRVGLLWTAGTPAALGVEATDGGVQLSVARAAEGGAYRRPLDPEGAHTFRVEGLGWGPLGARGAVLGRVVAQQLDLDAASPSDIAVSSASDPFVPTDTVVPMLRRVSVQLEGGIGGQFGAWAVGLTLGALVEDDHTRNSSFPRLVKRSLPGVAAGIARALPFAPVRLAVYARWMGGDETIILPGQPAPGTVYGLDGYSEPDPKAVTSSSPFFYRTDRSAWADGFAATGTLGGAAWTLYAERARRTDEHVSVRRLDAPTDRWHATGSAYGAAVQWPLARYDLYVTAQWRNDRLTGNATRADLTGVIFRATESVSRLTADVRYLPASAWAVAGTLSLVRESRRREDFIAETYTDLKAWTPGLGVEVARAFGSNAVSAGYAIAAYTPSGGIPDPSTMGPIYQQLIAAEQSLYATSVHPSLTAVTWRHTFPSRTALLLTARRASVGKGREVLTATLPYAPTGSRTLWNLTLGVVLGQ
jgi:hypothetical protein